MTQNIHGLIFDFDGLILDTEESEFLSWQEMYKEHNAVLSLEHWAVCIGGSSELFDVYGHLEEQIGRPVVREEIAARRRVLHHEMLALKSVLPGVENYIESAKRLGLKLGVASSSSRAWVVGHLERLGLYGYFDYIRCGNEVAHKKPDPELYLAVLDGLGIQADEAIALEDSPNGVRAAQRAGIFCVAVPNVITGQLNLAHADLRLSSMADMPLEELIQIAEYRFSENL
jgi:HAD superfamily hydrolase (TIGR01509 family)